MIDATLTTLLAVQNETASSLGEGPGSWTIGLVLVVLVSLGALLAAGQTLKRKPESHIDPAILRNFNKRVTSWLTICVMLVIALMWRSNDCIRPVDWQNSQS